REPHVDAARARFIPRGRGPRLAPFARRPPQDARMARPPPRPAARSKAPFPVLLGLILVAGAVALWRAWDPNDGVRADAGSPSATLPSSASPSSASPSPAGSGAT